MLKNAKKQGSLNRFYTELCFFHHSLFSTSSLLRSHTNFLKHHMTHSWITRLLDWIWDSIELIVWEVFRNVQSQCAQLWVSPPFHGLRWCFGNAGSLCPFCFHFPAGHERADADHWLASSGGLCWQLVWKGEVSSSWCRNRLFL